MYAYQSGAPDFWREDRKREAEQEAEETRRHEAEVNARIDAWGLRIGKILKIAGKVSLVLLAIVMVLGGGVAALGFALGYRRYPARGYRRTYSSR